MSQTFKQLPPEHRLAVKKNDVTRRPYGQRYNPETGQVDPTGITISQWDKRNLHINKITGAPTTKDDPEGLRYRTYANYLKRQRKEKEILNEINNLLLHSTENRASSNLQTNAGSANDMFFSNQFDTDKNEEADKSIE